MKKLLSLFAGFVVLLSPLAAEKMYNLDVGIETVAKNLSAKLPQGTKIVIFDIKADKPEASSYIIEELTYELLEIGKLVVVDRQSLDAIRSELSFQTSGDVSDDSAQRLGAMLGAQTLISGSFDLLNGKYRFSVKAVKVETSEIQYLSALSVYSNKATEDLFGKPEVEKKVSPGVSSIGKAAYKVADFTGRFICSSINPFFGIGSFMQGDSDGGGTVVFWELVGTGLVVYGELYMRDQNDSNAKYVTIAGSACLGLGVIYSIIRPWNYNRSPAITEVLDNVRVSYTASDSMSVGYVVKY